MKRDTYILKGVSSKTISEKSSFDPTVLANYWPVSNVPSLGKLIEWVMASQLQGVLEETDYLDVFQSGFSPDYARETALVTLVNDLRWEKDRVCVCPCWFCWTS